ncbi:hypothetical protein A8135_08830 [Legionella jamestowniensis]|uniref:Yip1 domain protein n=1 Tax=Legionella jamestowniensis TaxID=455 RepID=A0ABX2XW46_9GAMM|nr:hypothetical protein [Legionella jamestowniensis]OCH98858.1 hypothetical protein A8135_08830 [Legionella jamestowniensis]
MWEAILKRYWLVATFKESPANTPYSVPLLVFIAFLFSTLIILQWYMADIKQQFELLSAIAAGVCLILVYFIFTFVLLKVNDKVSRLIQSLTSLLASHLIVHIFALPLLIVAPALAAAKVSHGLALILGLIYLVLTLVLTVWQFLVTVHVYKLTLEVDNLTAVLASFGLLACNILTVSFWR